MNAQTQHIREKLNRHEALATPRSRVLGQLVLCEGCCCGQTDRGFKSVPAYSHPPQAAAVRRYPHELKSFNRRCSRLPEPSNTRRWTRRAYSARNFLFLFSSRRLGACTRYGRCRRGRIPSCGEHEREGSAIHAVAAVLHLLLTRQTVTPPCASSAASARPSGRQYNPATVPATTAAPIESPSPSL